jgi:hypothetical protein
LQYANHLGRKLEVKGHREVRTTDCPGDTFWNGETGWKLDVLPDSHFPPDECAQLKIENEALRHQLARDKIKAGEIVGLASEIGL